LLDAERHSAEAAAGQAAAFVREYRIGVLNVAGPRASGWPGAHAYAEACIGRLIALLGDNAPVGRRAP
jgi:hypothetical protein